ncbi:hypothetical protein CLV58_109238 [Spirosoma oryzae]|uniref:Uncharacterized protein n=1 Tax=Spirosoma oryzae TaxID=1469603 RepID=A0A2T0SYK2_9BACT|nr:hypothetical protein CLV58_109238 [Spirosoma oryzae]
MSKEKSGKKEPWWKQLIEFITDLLEDIFDD